MFLDYSTRKEGPTIFGRCCCHSLLLLLLLPLLELPLANIPCFSRTPTSLVTPIPQPISFDVPTIDVALQTVADNDVKLLLGFQRRFDSNFRTIREKVQKTCRRCRRSTYSMCILFAFSEREQQHFWFPAPHTPCLYCVVLYVLYCIFIRPAGCSGTSMAQVDTTPRTRKL